MKKVKKGAVAAEKIDEVEAVVGEGFSVEKFVESFDVLVEAAGGPEAVRALVLGLAIRGRVLEAVRGRSLQLPVSASLRTPFNLPAGWQWQRVDQVGEVKLGRQRAPSNHMGPNMRPYLRVANVMEARIDVSDVLQMNFEPEEVERFLLKNNDILLNEGQSYELVGRPAMYRDEVPGACFQNTLIRFRATPRVLPEFALIVFRAYMRTGRFRMEAQQTTNIAHLSAGRLAAIEFPLPPVAEQKQIVAKVDQLMVLCDTLEAQQVKMRETGARLTKSALEALTTAAGPEEFDVAWKLVVDNFEVLIDRRETVSALRQSILELATRGRLATQHRSDEPASKLLARIESARKAASGADRKIASSLPIDPAEWPFAVSGSWQWVRWGQLTMATDAGWSPQCENRPRENDEWGVLKVSAVSWDVFQPEENKALPKDLEPRHECVVQAGDFLMSRANTAALVGRSVIVGDAPERLMMSDKLVRCSFSSLVDKRYINIFNRTAAARVHYGTHASGTSDSMKNISRDVILSMPVALPPLEEQNRIVAKVSQLLKLCDDLEARLRLSEDRASRLAEAVVRDLVA